MRVEHNENEDGDLKKKRSVVLLYTLSPTRYEATMFPLRFTDILSMNPLLCGSSMLFMWSL